MNENINTTAAKSEATTTTKKKIVAKNLSAEDTVRLLRDIDSAVFQTDDDNLLIFNLPVCDIMVEYLKLHYYFPDDFEKIDGFGGFFDNLFAGKYKDYITAMDKTETAKLIDETVKTRKQIAIGRLQNPMTETLAKVNEILDNFTENFDGIESNDIKKFINDFGNFAKETNLESVTDAMLEKVITENKAAQSKGE